MKTLRQHISEALKISKNLSDWSTYTCQPKTKDELEDIMNNNRLEVNTKLAMYEKIGYIELRKKMKKKTPKKSIKRFLYVEENNK